MPGRAVHNLGLSARTPKELTVVKVCCEYFKGEVEKALQNKFGNSFVAQNIRIQLPANVTSVSSTNDSSPEE